MLNDIDKQVIVKHLSDKSKRMLNLIKDNPGISAKEIQKQLNLESGHTFSKHMKQLIRNKLVYFMKDGNDKRKKHFNLTETGMDFQKIINDLEVRNSLARFFNYCEDIFLSMNPEFTATQEWFKFKNEVGYSNSLIKQIENLSIIYIMKCVNELKEVMPLFQL
ncbi:MAG: winged helix-turn-helix transcriptional regulator [Candidatus Lokiarchaeota archaeon]|nr:winged helix-turn-helix transcriptional regulator [Candidatus Lokiarchaeota archaeon]